MQAATGKGASVIFKPECARITYKDGTNFDITKRDRLYFLDTYNDCQIDSDTVNLCNFDDVLQLENIVDGMKIVNSKNNSSDCSVCVLRKMTQGKSKSPRVRTTVPLELVHTDLAGPITPISSEGFKYAVGFTDDYSGMVSVYFIKSKSDTVAATERFLADTAPFGSVKCLRSDNGSELTSSSYQSLLRKHKITHDSDTSAPYSPHLNGTTERHWRTLFEMGRCCLYNLIWPKSYGHMQL